MAIVHFYELANHGIVRDRKDTEIPASTGDFAWSDGRNVRFRDGEVQKFDGQTLLVSTSASISFAMVVPTHNNFTESILFAWADNIRMFKPHSNTVITVTVTSFANQNIGRLDPTGDFFGRQVVLTDGVASPRQISTNGTAQYLQYDVSATTWDDLTGTNTMRILKRFGRFLVALDVTETSVLADMVWWSDIADDTGALPSSWDYTDPSNLSGRTTIKGGGRMQDFYVLRDQGIIYKDFETHVMQLGGPNVFRFRPLFLDRGVISRHCVGVLQDRHVVFGYDDIYVHDGVRASSLLTKRQRRYVFDNLNRAALDPARVAVNQSQGEVWMQWCDAADANWPTRTLVWNYEQDTVSERDVSNGMTAFAEFITGGAFIGPASVTASVLESKSQKIAVVADFPESAIYRADDTFTLNGTVMTSYVRRTGLHFGDPGQVSMITRIWPRITSTGTVNVRIGSQMFTGQAVTWSGYKTFDPSTQDELDFNVKGRYLAVEFQTSADVDWQLSGFSLDVSDAGRF